VVELEVRKQRLPEFPAIVLRWEQLVTLGARSSAGEDFIPVQFLRCHLRRAVAHEKAVHASLARNQSPLKHRQRAYDTVRRRDMDGPRAKELDVLGIRIHIPETAIDADAHLAALERTEGLLLKKRKSSIPQERRAKTHIHQRGRVAPPDAAVVRKADPMRIGVGVARVVAGG